MISKGFGQRVINQVCIIGCIKLVDHDIQHWRHCAQCCQRLKVSIKLKHSTLKLSCSQHIRGDGRNRHVCPKQGHLQHDGASALGIDQNQIKVLLKSRQQILETKAPVSSMEQQISQLIERIIGMDQ